MDLSLYRSRRPRLRLWPDTSLLIGVVPLSQTTIEDACSAVGDEWSARDLPPKSKIRERAEVAAVLSEALVDPKYPHERLASAEEILQECTVLQLSELYEVWAGVQEDSSPVDGSLEAEIELRIIDGDVRAETDALNASMAEHAGEFYGEPLTKLTIGQLAYFFCLRIVHNRNAERRNGKGTKCISRKHLELIAGRSENTNQRREGSSKSNGQDRTKWLA